MDAPAAALPVSTGFWAERVCKVSMPGPALWLKNSAAALTTLKIEEIYVTAAGIPGAMENVCNTLPTAAPLGTLAKGCKFLTDQRIWGRECV